MRTTQALSHSHIRIADASALLALVGGITLLGIAPELAWLTHLLAHILINLSALVLIMTSFISEYQRRIFLDKIQGGRTFAGGSHQLTALSAARLISSLLSVSLSLIFLSLQFPSSTVALCSALIFIPLGAAIVLRCCDQIMAQRLRRSANLPSVNETTPLLSTANRPQPSYSDSQPPMTLTFFNRANPSATLAPPSITSYTFKV